MVNDVSVQLLDRALREAPPLLRSEILDVARNTSGLAKDSFVAAGCRRPTSEEISVFVVVAAIRKLLSWINFQRRTISAVSQPTRDFVGFRIGRTEISTNAQSFRDAQAMEVDLRTVIEELGLTDLVSSATLRSLARKVHESLH